MGRGAGCGKVVCEWEGEVGDGVPHLGKLFLLRHGAPSLPHRHHGKIGRVRGSGEWRGVVERGKG